MIYSLDGVKVSFNGDAFVAGNATVIGNVSVGCDASIWFNVVIRGDNELITIGDKTNILCALLLYLLQTLILDTWLAFMILFFYF